MARAGADIAGSPRQTCSDRASRKAAGAFGDQGVGNDPIRGGRTHIRLAVARAIAARWGLPAGAGQLCGIRMAAPGLAPPGAVSRKHGQVVCKTSKDFPAETPPNDTHCCRAAAASSAASRSRSASANVASLNVAIFNSSDDSVDSAPITSTKARTSVCSRPSRNSLASLRSFTSMCAFMGIAGQRWQSRLRRLAASRRRRAVRPTRSLAVHRTGE